MLTNGYSWAKTFQTQHVCVLSCSIFVTLWTIAHQALLCMGFPGKNTGVGCHSLLQGIFLTQGSNPHLLHPLHLLHCRQILYCWATREALSDTISSVQLLSHVQLFATPRTATLQASLSITNSWSLLKLMSIKSLMPSNHLLLCRPLLLPLSIFPSMRVFSNESALRIRWPKYWFQLQHQFFQWIFRNDFL